MINGHIRDLTFVAINPSQSLVIACDSLASIGNKNKDCVKVDPENVGYFTAHVALSEILAIGAMPISLINTLSVEMTPTGKRILQGINEALENGNLSDDILVTGSTEENFPTATTAMGVTVLGLVDHRTWRMPKSLAGDLILVVGLPKVGKDVKRNNPDILDISKIKILRELPYIHEIVPVGSKGIYYEVDQIGKYSGLHYELNTMIPIDINQSSGPATCAVVTIDARAYDLIKDEVKLATHIIGKFHSIEGKEA